MTGLRHNAVKLWPFFIGNPDGRWVKRMRPSPVLDEGDDQMGTRIALVDDDQNILTSVSLTLESEGFEVDCYHDGESALRGLARRPVELAVLDIKMPRMDGMELLQKIRAGSSLPVIFLTSKDDELDEALGLGMGADDYITKPFSQRLLLARIRAVLRRAGQEGVDPTSPPSIK